MNKALNKLQHAQGHDEQGIALIMTVFVIALLTIIVFDFADETIAFQRRSRLFSERVQADAIIKSSVNLSRILLELPKDPQTPEDWLGEPWALIAAAPELPISGFVGEPKILIVDESGKININSILDPSQSATGGQPSAQSGLQFDYWKEALSKLMTAVGIGREQFEPSKRRTLGNVGFSPRDQVAVIHDWLDLDNNSHISASFPGEGIESGADKTWFLNRPLSTISEMLLIPGITRERLQKIAPFIRVSSSSNSKVNVNTASLPVLLALGFNESDAVDIIEKRGSLPITNDILSVKTAGDAQLTAAVTTRSQEFSVFVRVKMPNTTRYARALISVNPGSQGPGRATIRGFEFL